MKRKGIILAGGSGTRLHPLTKVVSKQLLPVYDKPMIYYPLSTLMLTGIRDILIISTPNDLPNYKNLLGTGKKYGLNIKYSEQPSPDGLAQALIIAEIFLNGSPSVLILGDNIFYGNRLSKLLLNANNNKSKTTLFAYHVNDPQRYGIVSFDKNFNATHLEEKPKKPKSNFAVTGLYFFDKDAPKYAKKLKPSKRNELEITDLNKIYLKEKKLRVEILNRGFTWLDTGTHESLLDANQFVHAIEKSQGLKIGCIEEIAFNNKWINKHDLLKLIKPMIKNSYGKYLNNLMKN